MEEAGGWKRFKLGEIISNPAFLGKTVRLGDSTFEIKGVDIGYGSKRWEPT